MGSGLIASTCATESQPQSEAPCRPCRGPDAVALGTGGRDRRLARGFEALHPVYEGAG